MWHELRVVLHNRENTLMTQAVHLFAKEESDFANDIAVNWSNFREAVQDMPYE
jgi:sorting nexin-8